MAQSTSPLFARLASCDSIARQAKSQRIEKTAAKANGLMFDRQGRLVLVRFRPWRYSCLDHRKSGKVRTLADNYEGKRLNSPNDLFITPKGHILYGPATSVTNLVNWTLKACI